MKLLLAMTLMFATALTADAQAPEKMSEAEVAVQKAMTELRQVPSDMKVLEDANRKLAISNQVQDDTTKMLNKQEQKIKNEDVPALIKRSDAFDAKVQAVLKSGCAANSTTDQALARRCNAANEEARKERAEIETAQADLISRMKMIGQTRTAVTATTLDNFGQQKKNNAALNDLQARKLALYSQVITRSMNLVKGKAAASQACTSLPNEKASCCLQVVSDGRNPAQCDVELLFKLFEKAGAFSTTEVKPIK